MHHRVQSACLQGVEDRAFLFSSFTFPKFPTINMDCFWNQKIFVLFTIKKQIMQPSGEDLQPSVPAFIQSIGRVSLWALDRPAQGACPLGTDSECFPTGRDPVDIPGGAVLPCVGVSPTLQDVLASLAHPHSTPSHFDNQITTLEGGTVSS